MTQYELIIEYCKEFGEIMPAKLYGFKYKDGMMGSELSKRCRELRRERILNSRKDGRFEVFWLEGMKQPQMFSTKQYYKD
jgi:hypothetical protein